MKKMNEAKLRNAPQEETIVPVGEGLRVVDVAAWHALAAQEVLWEEGKVCADEHHPEVQFACPFRVHPARHFREVEVDPGKDTEHGPKRHHVVEVCNHIVGVVIGAVDACLRQNDACNAAQCEQEQEAEGPQHWCFELDRAAPHCRDPREDLNPCRHRDNHGGHHEVGLLLKAHADRVHVVRPHNKAQRTNERPSRRPLAGSQRSACARRWR